MTEAGPAKTRRIIQLACAASPIDDKDLLVALCNDGSSWIIVWGDQAGEERWQRLVDIPQD